MLTETANTGGGIDFGGRWWIIMDISGLWKTERERIILLLSIYSIKCYTHVTKDMYTIFMTVLVVTAKKQASPHVPSNSKIGKMQYIHALGHWQITAICNKHRFISPAGYEQKKLIIRWARGGETVIEGGIQEALWSW